MGPKKLQTLKIDWGLFGMAFERDVNFEAYPMSSYLDRSDGDVFWFYDEDEDAQMEVGIPAEENRKTRHRMESDPDRYLLISATQTRLHARNICVGRGKATRGILL